MTSKPRHSADEGSQIDVVSLLRVIRGHPYILIATTVAIVALAVYLALTAKPIFRAEVVITEARQQSMGGLSGLAGQYGGLASLAGVNLSGNSSAERDDRAILQSRKLVEEFVKQPEVWAVLHERPAADKPAPTLWATVQNFRKGVLIITEDKLKGETTISIDWTDPAIAARWANGFVAKANELVRARAMDEANRNVDYLKNQIAHTNVVELQHVMYNLIETETKTLMLANARMEYAFTVIDPGVAPEVRISPRRTLMVAGGLVIGLFLGSLFALIYNVVRPRGPSVQTAAGTQRAQ